MSIGVISDTHGLLRPEALSLLSESDLIIHAGDIGGEFILEELNKIAPVEAVRGNIDKENYASLLPAELTVEVAGLKIYIIHDLKSENLNLLPADISAVISGHSHAASIIEKNGILFFNPGSAGKKRFSLPVSLGKLIINRGKIIPEILYPDQRDKNS